MKYKKNIWDSVMRGHYNVCMSAFQKWKQKEPIVRKFGDNYSVNYHIFSSNYHTTSSNEKSLCSCPSLFPFMIVVLRFKIFSKTVYIQLRKIIPHYTTVSFLLYIFIIYTFLYYFCKHFLFAFVLRFVDHSNIFR